MVARVRARRGRPGREGPRDRTARGAGLAGHQRLSPRLTSSPPTSQVGRPEKGAKPRQSWSADLRSGRNLAGLTSRDGSPKSFAIAGEDKKFHWADAKIDGDAIVVSSNDVPTPVAVRYAWEDDPTVNTYNAAGLPMCPFRTDDWKMSTAGQK